MSLTVTAFSMVSVVFTANSDAHRIAHYYIYIPQQGHTPTCWIPASNSVLECTFIFLEELTEYTFIESACLGGERCSLALKGKAKTCEKRALHKLSIVFGFIGPVSKSPYGKSLVL